MTTSIVIGDALASLKGMPSGSVHCCVTSPPYYGLRDYGVAGQMGLEPTLADYIAGMVDLFREVRRVLRDDGTLWCNIGDSYARNPSKGGSGTPNGRNLPEMGYSGGAGIHEGLKEKDLMMVPARLAIALQDDGWYLRSDIIWAKPNPMPESVTDRPTSAHEHVFLLTKAARYFYDAHAVREDAETRDLSKWQDRKAAGEPTRRGDPGLSGHTTTTATLASQPGRNLRNVWTIATQPFPGSHFATFPQELPERCIKAGTSERGCCPACGAPWVRVVERKDQGWDGSRYGERAVEATGGAKSGGTARSTLGSSGGKMTGKHETTGWAPSCACRSLECSACEGGGLGPVALAPNAPGGLAETCCEACAGKGMLPADPVPCTILDPFAGAFTTGMVAHRLGRHAIGLELNEAYAAMAEERLAADRGELPIEGVGLFAALAD